MEATKSKVDEWAEGTYRRAVQATYHKKQVEEYIEWSKKSPDQLIVEARETLLERGAIRHILEYKKYLQEQGTKTETVIYDSLMAVRSFYRFYGIVLRFSRNELEAPVSVYIDHRFSLNEINGMYHAANGDRNKAIILVAESTGLRESDIAVLQRARIQDLLNGEPPVCIGPINTIKKRVVAMPFLHKTAIDALKKYLATRTDDNPLLFPTDQGKPCMGSYLDRIVKEAYANAGFTVPQGERIRFHSLRKFTISRMQDSGLEENVWKSIIGKKNKEAPYTTEALREHFIKVQNRLDPNCLVSNGARMSDLEAKNEALEKEANELKLKVAGLEKNFDNFKLGVIRILDVLQSTALGVNPDSVRMAMEQLCDALGVDITEIRSTKQLRKIVTGKEEE
jgi:integrase